MLFAQIRPLLVLFSALLTISVIGCNNVPDSETSGTDIEKRKGGETDGEKCRRKLSTAIHRLAPERMAYQADPERAVNGLNSWIASCASEEAQALRLDEETLLLLNKSPRATAGRYTAGDALYVRDALMMRDVYQSLSERRSTSQQSAPDLGAARVMQSFAWVTQNISLLPADSDRPPLGLFDILMTGFGTAEDRAWAFAELLRQQLIDAVIVTTTAEPKATEGATEGTLETASWMVAVIQGEDGLLFDMQAGLPVTADAKFDVRMPDVARLSLLKDHERWQQSTMQVIGQVATFSPRMLVLQDQLAADDAAVLFEELAGGVSDIRPLLERVIAASSDLWAKEDCSVWNYPEQQVIRSNSLSEDELAEYRGLMRPFEAPFERDVLKPKSAEERTSVPEEMTPEERRDFSQRRIMEAYVEVTKSTEKLFGKPSHRLLKARAQQVLGVVDTSIIQQLQQIRLTSLDDMIEIQVPDEVLAQNPGMPDIIGYRLPAVIQEVNRSSTGSSMYWTALSQLDRGELGIGVSTMKNYRRLYPDGPWKYPSLLNQAVALLSLDRTDDAVQVLQEANASDNPEQLRVERLLTAMGAMPDVKPDVKPEAAE